MARVELTVDRGQGGPGISVHDEAILLELVTAIAADETLDDAGLRALLRRHTPAGGGFFAKAEIIAAYRRHAKGHELGEEARFLARVRMNPVRTASGVAPVTVLTRPHPCPGRCIYCPSDARMPKSYLPDEPGAQRAAHNEFDPYRQTASRLRAFHRTGHATDKVELLILGGTWSASPGDYQRWFVRRCLDAMNDFPGSARAGSDGKLGIDWTVLPAIAGGQEETYDDVVGGALQAEMGDLHAAWETTSWDELGAAQRHNETAEARAIGIVVETRPDRIDEAEVVRIRRLGATKVQLGVQSLDDAILARNRRGHTSAATRRAFALLRAAGFKIVAHWMPNLLGATIEGDARELELLFDDPALRPDELKIYPTVLIESAELVAHHRAGEWRPYDETDLAELLADALARVPRWCRVNRVIRDFPATDIAAGSRRSNLREEAERILAARAGRSVDIRAREVRGAPVDPAVLELRATTYPTDDADETFLELVDEGDRLTAFLRLRLPRAPSFIDELGDSAIVRELHVYGQALPLGARAGAPQHRGLGARLLRAAAERARAAGFRDLAVISGVGTRAYYRRHGFTDGVLYQHSTQRPPQRGR